jgi:hypothetical protein
MFGWLVYYKRVQQNRDTASQTDTHLNTRECTWRFTTAQLRFDSRHSSMFSSCPQSPDRLRVPASPYTVGTKYVTPPPPPQKKIKCPECEASPPLSTRLKLTESIEMFLTAHTIYYAGVINSFRCGLAWTKYKGILCSFGRDAAF